MTLLIIASIVFVVSTAGLAVPTFYRRLLRRFPITKYSDTTSTSGVNFSVIIPCYNEGKGIIHKVTETLRQLLTITNELIIVDDGSTDGTYELVRNHFGSVPNVIILQQPRLGKNSAINAAAAVSSKEWLIVTDANAELDSGSIQALLPFCASENVGVVRGKYLPTQTSSPFTSILNSFRQSEDQLFNLETSRGLLNLSGGWLQAIRRTLVNIHEERTMVEDWDLTLYAVAQGYTVAYAPSAVARKKVPLSAREILQQNIRYIYGTLQTLLKYRRLLKPQTKNHMWFAIIAGKGSQSLAPLWLTACYGSALFLLTLAVHIETWIALVLFFTSILLLYLVFLIFSRLSSVNKISHATSFVYVCSVFFAGLAAYTLFILRRGANWTGWQPIQSIRT